MKTFFKQERQTCGYPRSATAFRHEPKLTMVKIITGTWGVDVRFFDRFPKNFGENTHFGSGSLAKVA
jgi:hypothetical protein